MRLRYGEMWRTNGGDALMALGVREPATHHPGMEAVERMLLVERVSYRATHDAIRFIDAIVFDEPGSSPLWTRIDE